MDVNVPNKPSHTFSLMYNTVVGEQKKKEKEAEETRRRCAEEGTLDETISKEFYGALLPEVGKPTQRHNRDSLYKALKAIMRTFKVMLRNVEAEKEIMEG